MPIAINGDGTITGVSVGGMPDGIVDTDMLATSAVTGAKIGSLPAGSILQVVQTIKTDTASQAGQNTMADVPGMSVAITPSSTSSKVLVRVCIGVLGASTANRGVTFTLLRDSTAIGLGDDSGNANIESCTFASYNGASTYMEGGRYYEILDSPSTTSQVTYKLQWQTVGNTSYINQSASTSTGEWNKRGSSTITAMEVAG